MAGTDLLDEAEAIALTVAYQDELGRIGELVGEAVRDVFRSMSTIQRHNLAEYLAQAEPLVRAGAAEGSDLAGAYLAELTGVALPPGGPIDLAKVGIDLDGAYHRTWHELGQGRPWDEAFDSGASVAELDGRDSAQRGASTRMADPAIHVGGFRRVITAGACEWCRVVATQIYQSEQTATFGHHGCNCTVVPVGDTLDPGKAINSARLRELKAGGAVKRVSVARERSRAREGRRR
jgi:hypothetical protein